MTSQAERQDSPASHLMCVMILQAIQKLREGNVLDEELLNTIFYKLQLGELTVHHQIQLKNLIKQTTDERSEKSKSSRPKSKWDVNTGTIGTVMYNTVSRTFLLLFVFILFSNFY